MSDLSDPQKKAEDNRRMMIAFAISAVALLTWEMLFPSVPVPVAQEAKAPVSAAAPAEASKPVAKAEAVKAPAAETEPVAEKLPPRPAVKPETHLLENEALRVVISNVGARPSAVGLTDLAHNKPYREPGRDKDRPSVDLAADRADFGALTLPGLKADQVWEIRQRDLNSILLVTQAGSTELLREWKLTPHGLEHHLAINATAPAAGAARMSLSMIDPGTGGSIFSGPPDLPRALCHNGQELKASTGDELEDKDKEHASADAPIYFGVDRNFFLAAFAGEGFSNCSTAYRSVGEGDDKLDIVVVSAENSYQLNAGAKAEFSNLLYLLPKSDELLASVDEKLRDSIDFGMFKFIAQPMLWLLTFLFSVVGNYGVAIILLTLTIKVALWPITDMSFKSMARMKAIQPELNAMREKYKTDKQAMAQKQMELFKERGVNPAGGCLPMMLQIPVWFALYSTLRVAVELYGSPFIPGWLDDLTLADPYYILPVLLGGVFLVQQKVQPQMGDNAQQQMMMKVMPIMMTVFMIALPSGLVVYILINTVLGIAHQLYRQKKDVPAT